MTLTVKTATAAALVVLSGCQTTPQDEYIWVRTDGHRMGDDPSYGQRFELDRTVCFGEVQRSAAGAPVIYYQGLSGAITASMIQGQQQSAYLDIMKGCMAGKGYVFTPKSQAQAVSDSYKANPVPRPA